jgi:beta-N-acetylhexosaminidase
MLSAQNAWVLNQFKKLTNDEKIAQLMVVRLSEYAGPGKHNYFGEKVIDLIKKYNIGGVCVFQGGPLMQAQYINYMQQIAKTPIMFCIDAEWGLGMRIDSVPSLPRQMMLGAMQNEKLVYEYGALMARQFKRFGLHVNYAPVIDVNNNPLNPVINDRSFGQDKITVARYGIAITKGMEDNGILACAKHFPGHGDVAVDSHFDLPVINKSMAELTDLELYPFKELFKAGVGSTMVAHLSIPSIDNAPNMPTSISKKNVTGLLRDKMGYKGLTFTDALNMEGVAKFYPNNQAAVQSLIAGNDMLCLPSDVPGTIKAVKEAIKENKLTWKEIDEKVLRVLEAKYKTGLQTPYTISYQNLLEDLQAGVADMTKKIAIEAITHLPSSQDLSATLPANKKTAIVLIGTNKPTAFSNKINEFNNYPVYCFDFKQNESQKDSILALVKSGNHEHIITAWSGFHNRPAKNFLISDAALQLHNEIQKQAATQTTLVFGNPYAINLLNKPKNLIACYEEKPIIMEVAADMLLGKYLPKGRLPVQLNDYNLHQGKISQAKSAGANFKQEIDNIVNQALAAEAIPGCVVMAAHKGKIIFSKAYGYTDVQKETPTNINTLYDLASVTKTTATTLAVMKLYEQGKLDLNKTIGDYLPAAKNTNKANITIKELLIHQGGMVAYIPFYKALLDSNQAGSAKYFAKASNDTFNIEVAKAMYLRKDYNDSIFKIIYESKTDSAKKYVYSDNDFIFLGKIVESISGVNLDQYVRREFYDKLGLNTMGFQPLKRFSAPRIAATENENFFRKQKLQGFVHDPGAAMLGGIAGHAGLFSSAADLLTLYQMLLQNGTIGSTKIFKPSTVNLFTAWAATTRRGLGFDKTEKDNFTRNEGYPSRYASAYTYGHTGFTGTCVWVDPVKDLVYVFLSNRVNMPEANHQKLLKMNIRTRILDALYEGL